MISGLWKQRLTTHLAGRAFGFAAAMVLFLITIGCGDQYRPVAQPITGPSPNPSSIHFIYAISTNGDDILNSSGTCSPSGSAPPCIADPGAMSRIDVSGDSVADAVSTGVFPIHAALTPDGSKYYVANSDDTVSAGATSSGTPATTVNLPQLCDSSGCALSSPVFLNSTENTKMYVANSGNGTVAFINATSNVVVQSVAVNPAFAGNPLPSPDRASKPVALAELPNGSKIYSANQGNNTVTSINTIDGTIATVIPLSGSPVWAVAGSDNVHVYVLDTSGTISVISSLSDTVTSASASAGAGANFMLYDQTSNLLYVTNPNAGTLSIFDVSIDPPVLRSGSAVAIPIVTGSSCTSAPKPASVTVLPDGTRAYVASYQADPSGAVCTQASVIAPGTATVSKSLALSQTTNTPQTLCSAEPFRVFAVASGGGANNPAKVYISQCDAGTVGVIDTFPVNTGPDPHAADVLEATVPTPVSSFPVVPGQTIPPFQNPVFMVGGP